MSPGSPWAGLRVAIYTFLPGVLAGAHIGCLLFFLNPRLPFDVVSIFAAAVLYGGFLGVVTGLLQWPFLRGDEARARRWLPWGVTVALMVAATVYAVHASRFAFYLPAGINQRLIKAAVLLSAAALIAFYTSLLHSLHSRPYGVRSRFGLVLIAVASLYVAVERRDAYQPQPERLRSSALGGVTERPVLVVVALESASLDAVLPLAEQGRLPFFATMLREGAGGPLDALRPYRRPAAWMSLATGKNPYRHGVMEDRLYPLPRLGERQALTLWPAGLAFERWGLFGVGAQEVDREDQRALPLWEVLPRLGGSVGVVGWPLTSPPAPELSVVVSEAFFQSPDERSPDEVPGAAAPEEIAERARLFRVAPEDIDPVLLARFGEIVPSVVVEALAADTWRETLSVYLLDQYPDLSAYFLALPGLRRVSEAYFGGYAAVQFDGSEDEEDRQAAEALAAYYEHLDAFLQELWEGLPRPAVLAVVSPAGARPHSLAARLLTAAPSQGSRVDSDADGLLLVYGDGARGGERLAEGRTVDVVPTLLWALGYPVARDMDGQVLTPAFDTEALGRPSLAFVPSYEAMDAPPPAR
ncbi:MAG: alkaline phosphatase family protein [Acidobacteriota bacterium]